MKNFKISSKLSMSFFLINTIFIVSIIALLFSYMLSNERLHRFKELVADTQTVIVEMHDTIAQERLVAGQLILFESGSPEYTAMTREYDSERQRAIDAIGAYVDLFTDESELSAAKTVQAYYQNEYSAFLKQLLRLSGDGDSAAVAQWISESREIEDNMSGKLEDAAAAIEQKSEALIGDAAYGLVRLIIIAAVVIVFIIIIIMCIIKYMQRNISKRIERLTEAANVLAVGKLDIDISKDSTDEIGQLTESFLEMARSIGEQSAILSAVSEGDLTVDIAPRSDEDTMNLAIRKMITSLNDMFAQISDTTERVSSGSKQIAGGAQAVAQGAAEQTSAVDEISTAIVGVTKTTQESYVMAKQAAELVDRFNNNASIGSEQMSNMSRAMQEIGTASQAISKVIKAIDDIAFQTNILALNAAVEAARAGQHGKGFAVVADEVRSLASRSAEAAKETGALIANSMEKAEFGTGIAEEAIESFEQIAEGIKKSAGLLGDIAHMSEQQNTSIHQISQSIEQVAQVVQQNSATAEESAASSEELSSQSEVLKKLTYQFKLKSANRPASNAGQMLALK